MLRDFNILLTAASSASACGILATCNANSRVAANNTRSAPVIDNSCVCFIAGRSDHLSDLQPRVIRGPLYITH